MKLTIVAQQQLDDSGRYTEISAVTEWMQDLGKSLYRRATTADVSSIIDFVRISPKASARAGQTKFPVIVKVGICYNSGVGGAFLRQEFSPEIDLTNGRMTDLELQTDRVFEELSGTLDALATEHDRVRSVLTTYARAARAR